MEVNNDKVDLIGIKLSVKSYNEVLKTSRLQRTKFSLGHLSIGYVCQNLTTYGKNRNRITLVIY